MIIRVKASGNQSLDGVEIPENIDSTQIQKLLSQSQDCMKLLALARSEKVIISSRYASAASATEISHEFSLSRLAHLEY